MDSVPSASALTGLVSTSSAAPDAGINEIGELILAEHARILRLFGARSMTWPGARTLP